MMERYSHAGQTVEVDVCKGILEGFISDSEKQLFSKKSVDKPGKRG
jgi:hypothetical protein